MPFELDTASAATCAAIAQIMPVFLVALIAERVVVSRSDDPTVVRRSMLAAAFRVLVDLTIAVGLLTCTGLALVGIEIDGWSGEPATGLWLSTGVLCFVILYRWLLLSTPLLSLINVGATRVAEGIVDRMVAVVDGMLTATDGLVRAVEIAGELLISIISVGMSPGLRLAELIARRTAALVETRDEDPEPAERT